MFILINRVHYYVCFKEDIAYNKNIFYLYFTLALHHPKSVYRNNPYIEINVMDLKNDKNDYLIMISASDHAILSLPIYKCINSLFSEDTSDSPTYTLIPAFWRMNMNEWRYLDRIRNTCKLNSHHLHRIFEDAYFLPPCRKTRRQTRFKLINIQEKCSSRSKYERGRTKWSD